MGNYVFIKHKSQIWEENQRSVEFEEKLKEI